MELVIEADLSVLHGHENLQLLFKLQKSLVSSALLSYEVVDVGNEYFHVEVSPLLVDRDGDAVNS